MDSKSGESNISTAESNFKFSNNSCDHLIATSLRDLSNKYKDLSREQVNSKDLNKKDIAKIVQGTNLDKKWISQYLLE